jgi:hypothetical protein
MRRAFPSALDLRKNVPLAGLVHEKHIAFTPPPLFLYNDCAASAAAMASPQ